MASYPYDFMSLLTATLLVEYSRGTFEKNNRGSRISMNRLVACVALMFFHTPNAQTP